LHPSAVPLISIRFLPSPLSFRRLQENPFREYAQVSSILAYTQKEHDERRHMTNRWWMPYHIGRENWFDYDTKSAWFWSNKGENAKKPAPGKVVF
jgi:hypothetical protein